MPNDKDLTPEQIEELRKWVRKGLVSRETCYHDGCNYVIKSANAYEGHLARDHKDQGRV